MKQHHAKQQSHASVLPYLRWVPLCFECLRDYGVGMGHIRPEPDHVHVHLCGCLQQQQAAAVEQYRVGGQYSSTAIWVGSSTAVQQYRVGGQCSSTAVSGRGAVQQNGVLLYCPLLYCPNVLSTAVPGRGAVVAAACTTIMHKYTTVLAIMHETPPC